MFENRIAQVIDLIEKALKIPVEEIRRYHSGEIHELVLTDKYYLPELSEYSEDELKVIEEEFNKTHEYKVRLKETTNPFKDIDFNNLKPD